MKSILNYFSAGIAGFAFLALGLWTFGTGWLIMPGDAQASGHSAGTQSAIFAGGCFWCVESDFDKVPGVLATTSGYAGGTTENPTYKEVTYGDTGHYEVVKIDYDPSKVTYDQLLTAFWHSVDPTDDGGQFCDRGHSYKTAIFTLDDQQAQKAIASKKDLLGTGKNIVTPIYGPVTFYSAEEYHQNYYQRNWVRYTYYRTACGRDRTVKAVWGKDAYKGIPKE